MIKRRKTKTVKIGSVKIGSRYPVSIQSMAKTDTQDVPATVRQIRALAKAGCEIVRVAVKNSDCIAALGKIKAQISLPLVADIHFNYYLALKACACGIDGLRLNPGNIYRREELKQIVKAAKKRRISIRVGVNSGSLRTANRKPQTDLSSEALAKEENREPKTENIANAMLKSAQAYIKMLEDLDFYDIIVSLKASDVTTTVDAYKRLANHCDYPLHLGITACGLSKVGTIKSAVGIGSLLLAGIGDTIRVSLTASPQEEVLVAKEILQSLGLRNFTPEIISCPTCGRCNVNLEKIVQEISRKLNGIRNTEYGIRPPKVAIMGCEVNGPGEAKDADLGIAAGKGSGLLFKKGKVIKKVRESQMVDALFKELANHTPTPRLPPTPGLRGRSRGTGKP